MSENVAFVVANDRYQVVTCADQGSTVAVPEIRYWYAGPPLWSESIGDDPAFPPFHTLNEYSEYVPGSLELPYKTTPDGKEATVDGVIIQFNTRPTSISESIDAAFSLGFSVRAEGHGVPGYSRTVSGVETTGVATSTTVAYVATAGTQADEPWPNTRSAYLPVRLNQRVKTVRVVITDIHLVEIVDVQLIGDLHPSRNV